MNVYIIFSELVGGQDELFQIVSNIVDVIIVSCCNF